MKKLLLFILVTFAAIGLSATAGYAAPLPPTYDPGCDPLMMTLLTDQANAVRARDRGYELEILSREPSTLYLTCFDQSMALSARLGLIFSDVFYQNPPPPNTLAYTGTLAYPDWGASWPSGPPPYDNLAMELDVVVSPLLDNWLGGEVVSGQTTPSQTNPAVFNFYPAQWQSGNNQLTQLAGTIKTDLNAINKYQTTSPYTTDVSNYQSLVNKIDTLVNALPSDSWSSLPSELSKYTSDIGSLNSAISTLESNEKTALSAQFTNIKNALMQNQMNCTNIDDMWRGAGNFTNPGSAINQTYDDTVTSFTSPEGAYNALTPFYSMADLLNYNSGSATRSPSLTIPNPAQPKGTPTTLYFSTELQDSTDNSMLTNALNDLVNTLPKPGASTLWPAPPTLPSYFQTQDVIQQM